MKIRFLILVVMLALFGVQLRAQDPAPLKLVQTFKMPPEVKGNFDHFAVDLSTGRLFATPEAYSSL